MDFVYCNSYIDHGNYFLESSEIFSYNSRGLEVKKCLSAKLIYKEKPIKSYIL